MKEVPKAVRGRVGVFWSFTEMTTFSGAAKEFPEVVGARTGSWRFLSFTINHGGVGQFLNVVGNNVCCFISRRNLAALSGTAGEVQERAIDLSQSCDEAQGTCILFGCCASSSL